MILLMDSCSWLAYHWGFNVCWWIKILIRYSHFFLSTSGPWQIYQYNNYRLNIYWFFYFSFVNNSTGNYLWNIFYCYFHRKYPTQMFYHYFHRTLPTNCLSQCACVCMTQVLTNLEYPLKSCKAILIFVWLCLKL
jgi:hypothetical protein